MAKKISKKNIVKTIVITNPKGRKVGEVIFFKTQNKQFRWGLFANGKEIAGPQEQFKRLAGAEKNLASCDRLFNFM